MSTESATGFTTHEVTLPSGVNEDTLALYGIGSALGWNIKQRVAFPSDLKRGSFPEVLVVTPDSLKDVSEELYGTEVYGENAERFLAEDARTIKERYFVYASRSPDNRTIQAWSDLAYHYVDREEGSVVNSSVLAEYSDGFRSMADDTVEANKIAAAVAQFWPVTPFPFEAPTVAKMTKPKWSAADDATTWWELQPGPLSRARLAHYARTSGIAQHALRGAIGKTHDVINVTAGLATKAEVIERHRADTHLEFVDYKQFRDMLKHSGLTRYGQDEIRHAIEWPVSSQMQSGSQGWRAGRDIVVEGAAGWITSGSSRLPYFQKIAKLSLAKLLEHDRPTRNVAPRKFLAQFAA